MSTISPLRSNTVIILASLIVISIGIPIGWYMFRHKQAEKTQATSFEGCRQAKGSRLLESYPEICITSGGQRITNPNQSAPNANGR